MRIVIRVSVAGFQLTLPLGTLRLPAAAAGSRHDGIRRRPSTRQLTSAQHSDALLDKTPQHGNCLGTVLPAEQRAATRLALLRRRLEAGSRSAAGSGAGRGPAGAAPAGGGQLLSGERVLDVLRLTGEDPDDAFLLRWLRSRDGDVDEAEAGVRAHSEWRAQHVQTGGINEVCGRPQVSAFC